VAPTHAMPYDVPPENVVAFIKAVQDRPGSTFWKDDYL